MRTSAYFIAIVIFLTVLSCTYSSIETRTVADFTPDIETTPTQVQLNRLDGHWIMSDYIDGILKTRSIQEYREGPLTWTALVLEVKGDSMSASGLFDRGTKVVLRKNVTKLAFIQGEAGEYQLSYNESTGLINAKCVSKPAGIADTTTYTFRRIKHTELRLVSGLKSQSNGTNLESKFYSFFIDSLISGMHTPVNGITTNQLDLTADGFTSGFKGYNKYFIHSYFGTLHPYTPADAIIFTDTTVVNHLNQAPINIGVYNWKFIQDTMILTEMLTENHEQFYLGTKTYVFVKCSN